MVKRRIDDSMTRGKNKYISLLYLFLDCFVVPPRNDAKPKSSIVIANCEVRSRKQSGTFINGLLRVITLAMTLLITSCSSNVTYTESHVMKDRVWRLMDVKSFNVQITDTAAINDIFFTIRSGTDYPYRNIFLFVSTFAPDGNILTDTLEYFLTDDKGVRYGKGFGDVRELKLPYREYVFFPQRGEYKFRVQHGMRIEDLRGVYDIGLRVEKTKTK